MGLFGFGKKENKENDFFTSKFFLVEGIPFFKKGATTKVTLNDDLDCLVIEQSSKDNKDVVKIKYENITNIIFTSEKEIEEQSKSVAGRAVLGGVILGPVGALVGGASGIGNKVTKKPKNLVVLNYKSERDNEVKVIVFEIFDMKWDKFIKLTKERALKNQETIEFL